MYKSSLLAGLLLAVVGLTTACKGNKEREVGDLKTRESGLQYQFFRLGEEQAPDSTQLLVMHMRATLENDSLLFDTQESGQPEIMYANNPSMTGMFSESIKLLHKGDSAMFIIPANNFFIQTMRQPVPNGISENSKIKFYMGVMDVANEEGARQLFMEGRQKAEAKQAARQKELLVQDIKTIDQHLAKQNVNPDTTNSGVRIHVKELGKGPKPTAGDSIVVHYNGTLLSGEKFDSSYDRNQPISIPVGVGQVIRGWDESLLQLPEGTKATLYIPSPLGYGPQQASEVLKPNSILVFDVEVLDVKKQ